MKYIITESKLQSLIYEYLTDNFYPDYNWGPELHEFYRNEIKSYGSYDFMINDDSAFFYIGPDNETYRIKGKTLLISPWLKENLNTLFGDLWPPVFVKWFEDNSGLPVEHVKDWV